MISDMVSYLPEKFQYILCYGSTLALLLLTRLVLISIHLMLRFNAKCNNKLPTPKRFQYILCYGSTVRSFMFLLNFTFISIHLMLRFNQLQGGQQFIVLDISIHLMLRFNLTIYFYKIARFIISIHLMLRFNFNP